MIFKILACLLVAIYLVKCSVVNEHPLANGGSADDILGGRFSKRRFVDSRALVIPSSYLPILSANSFSGNPF